MKFESEDGIELWLLGWQESHNGGCKVTFQVTQDVLEKFRTATVKNGKVAGQRYCAILIELDAHEQPVQKEPAKKAATGDVTIRVVRPGTGLAKVFEAAKEPAKRTDAQRVAMSGFCGLAIKWCDVEHFQKWLAFAYPNQWAQATAPTPAGMAPQTLKRICRVESRKELDTNEQAGRLFDTLIRTPYAARRKADNLDG